MSVDFDGSSYYYLSAPISTYPFTFSCWAQKDTANTGVISLVDASVDNQNFLLYFGSPSYAYFFTQSGASSQQNAGIVIAAGTTIWHFMGAVARNSTSRSCFSAWTSADSTLNINPTGIDRLCIGARGDATPDFYHDGRIAEVGIWNVDLTDEEMWELHHGFRPPQIRPQNLVFYIPLIRPDARDLIGGSYLTQVGTPSAYASHPALFY